MVAGAGRTEFLQRRKVFKKLRRWQGLLISRCGGSCGNPRAARAYNISAFVLALVLLGCLEVVLRFTVAGQSWAGVRAGPMAMDIFSEVSTTQQEFSIFDAGEPTAYPAAGYPVRIPPPNGATRVITAGSSSTGGAYQNDDLSEFYPARMQELLSGQSTLPNEFHPSDHLPVAAVLAFGGAE